MTYLRSISAALLIAGLVLTITVWGVAPSLPRVVGGPAVSQEREFTWPSVTTIHLRNHDGVVRVTTHPSGEVVARVSVRVYALESGAEVVAQGYTESLFHALSEEGILELATETGERPDALDVVADYTLYVPKGTNLDIESANGNVRVAGGCGSVKISGRNTDVMVDEPKGAVEVASVNGRINLVNAPEAARLRTVNGNIYAHMMGGELLAETTNGAIVAHMMDPAVAGFDLTSQNGGVTLVMPEECSASVRAQTALGEIRSDFPVNTAEGVDQRRRLEGTIGGGYARVALETLNGNIWIARAK